MHFTSIADVQQLLLVRYEITGRLTNRIQINHRLYSVHRDIDGYKKFTTYFKSSFRSEYYYILTRLQTTARHQLDDDFVNTNRFALRFLPSDHGREKPRLRNDKGTVEIASENVLWLGFSPRGLISATGTTRIRVTK